jgi:acetylglutamate kinase
MAKKSVVIKIGGSTFGKNDTTTEDLVKLQSSGIKLIVVHGGGKTINEWLAKINLPTKFVNGLRVTDLESLKVATAVLAGLVSKEIVSDIWKCGGKALGMCGIDGQLIKATNINPDLGYVGEELEVNADILEVLTSKGFIPVVAPICLNVTEGHTNESNLINVNGDTVAAEIAAAVGAEKLIFLTDVPGLYDKSNKSIDFINSKDARELIKSGVITGGMVVKIEACVDALKKVAVTRIIDGRVPHALINEVEGIGHGTTIAS